MLLNYIVKKCGTFAKAIFWYTVEQQHVGCMKSMSVFTFASDNNKSLRLVYEIWYGYRS